MEFNWFTGIKLLLALFISLGLGLTLFMISKDVKIIGAYVVSVLFFLVPGMILYGLTFGFKVSARSIKKQAERQERVTFDNNGISYQLPLFDTIQFISWRIIETIIYTNYESDDHSQFIFYLTAPPSQTMQENPWFLNRLFPFAGRNRREITITADCKNFDEIPAMLDKYLAKTNPIDLTEDFKRGTLLSSATKIKGDRIKTEEIWKPNLTYEREKVVYDIYNRSFQQIKHARNTR
jgi:hypothetical protein